VSRAFETEGDDVVVVHQDGRVRLSPVPDDFDRATFRDILAAVDVLYRREGVFPTVEEVHKSWPKISKKTYSRAFATSEFKQALELRGISMSESHGLTAEQATALLVLTNPDGRPLVSKLRGLGISMPKYQAWMRQPLFSETYRNRSEQNLGDAIPVALNNLISNADKGDQRAIEKLLEITGRYNPNQIEVDNARQVVLVMVEAVLKHVTDKSQRTAILAEVENAMVKGSITSGLKEIG
jgi:hypothetical protein